MAAKTCIFASKQKVDGSTRTLSASQIPDQRETSRAKAGGVGNAKARSPYKKKNPLPRRRCASLEPRETERERDRERASERPRRGAAQPRLTVTAIRRSPRGTTQPADPRSRTRPKPCPCPPPPPDPALFPFSSAIAGRSATKARAAARKKGKKYRIIISSPLGHFRRKWTVSPAVWVSEAVRSSVLLLIDGKAIYRTRLKAEGW